MKLFQRIFFAAVLAGLVAGIAMTAFQQWRVAPLLLEAETYETAEAAPMAMPADATAAEPMPASHDAAEAWAPQDGAERIAYTVLANILGALGFAFALAAISVLVGIPITLANGVLWGLGAFIAVQLAPAAGLAPGLPGMPVIAPGPRQLWWLFAVVSTGAGLLLVARFRNSTAIGAAVVLLLLPHIIGAPAPSPDPSTVPPGLALTFAYNAMAASALFWLTCGPLLGWFSELLARREAGAFRRAAA